MRTKILQCDPGQCRSLSHKHAFHVGACEKTALYVMHAVGVYSVYTSRGIAGTTFRPSETRLSETACSVKKMSLTVLRQILKNATTMNSNFAIKNSAMIKTTKTRYAASFPAAFCTISILFSDQQRGHIIFTFFDVLTRILTPLFAWVDGCVELLDFCHKLVLQSLTFSFCFFVFWALLSRWLRSMSIYWTQTASLMDHVFLWKNSFLWYSHQ